MQEYGFLSRRNNLGDCIYFPRKKNISVEFFLFSVEFYLPFIGIFFPSIFGVYHLSFPRVILQKLFSVLCSALKAHCYVYTPTWSCLRWPALPSRTLSVCFHVSGCVQSFKVFSIFVLRNFSTFQLFFAEFVPEILNDTLWRDASASNSTTSLHSHVVNFVVENIVRFAVVEYSKVSDVLANGSPGFRITTHKQLSFVFISQLQKQNWIQYFNCRPYPCRCYVDLMCCHQASPSGQTTPGTPHTAILSLLNKVISVAQTLVSDPPLELERKIKFLLISIFPNFLWLIVVRCGCFCSIAGSDVVVFVPFQALTEVPDFCLWFTAHLGAFFGDGHRSAAELLGKNSALEKVVAGKVLQPVLASLVSFFHTVLFLWHFFCNQFCFTIPVFFYKGFSLEWAEMSLCHQLSPSCSVHDWPTDGKPRYSAGFFRPPRSMGVFHCLIGRLNDWFIDFLVDCSIDSLIDWSIDWLVDYNDLFLSSRIAGINPHWSISRTKTTLSSLQPSKAFKSSRINHLSGWKNGLPWSLTATTCGPWTDTTPRLSYFSAHSQRLCAPARTSGNASRAVYCPNYTPNSSNHSQWPAGLGSLIWCSSWPEGPGIKRIFRSFFTRLS